MSKSNNERAYQTHDFGSKICFTVGLSFLFGMTFGCGQAILQAFKPAPAFQTILVAKKKVAITHFLNNLGKFTTQSGNAFAASGLLFSMTGSTLGFLFEQDLDQLQPLIKNGICGLITGFIYKLPRGLNASFVGAGVGLGLITALGLAVEKGNQKGYVSFEINY